MGWEDRTRPKVEGVQVGVRVVVSLVRQKGEGWEARVLEQEMGMAVVGLVAAETGAVAQTHPMAEES